MTARGIENRMSNIVIKVATGHGRVWFYIGQFGIVMPLRVLF